MSCTCLQFSVVVHKNVTVSLDVSNMYCTKGVVSELLPKLHLSIVQGLPLYGTVQSRVQCTSVVCTAYT